jgi:guanine nucleotide-binding protein subunit alpha
MQRHPEQDPLARALKPPLDESLQDKAKRLKQEDDAARVSLEIDESIRQERQLLKKMSVVRLLLLGQSESGVQSPFLLTPYI